MGKFNQHRDGGFGDKQMFVTTCANCGNKCEVPFKPTGDRPVYCNNCFNKMKDSDSGRGERRSFGNRDNRGFGDKQMFSATCDNCGRHCEVPFKPTGEKPILCDDCFRNRDNPNYKPSSSPKASEAFHTEIMEKVDALSAKLDRLVRALELQNSKSFVMPKEEGGEAEISENEEKPKVKKEEVSKPKAKKAEVKKPASKKSKKA